MSQISPPIRILLVCAVAFMGAWMLFLRPKEETVPPADTATPPNTQTSDPAVSDPGKVAEAAQDAVDAANGQLSQQESVDGVDAGEVGAATGTKAKEAGSGSGSGAAAVAADLKGVPKAVRKAIRQHDVLVLLFWNRASADDRAVRSALRDVDRWDGRVHVDAAPLKAISRYGRITRGADVKQSPTIVVVDPELRAETLVGYADTTTIDQMVVDALRNTTGLFTSTYLREINSLCSQVSNSLWAIPSPDNRREFASFFTTSRGKWNRFEAKFKAIPAPKKFRALKRATVADNAAWGALMADWAAYLGPKPTLSRIVTSYDRFIGRNNEIARRYNRRMDDEHVLSCGSDA